jgi:hypothetical protein
MNSSPEIHVEDLMIVEELSRQDRKTDPYLKAFDPKSFVEASVTDEQWDDATAKRPPPDRDLLERLSKPFSTRPPSAMYDGVQSQRRARAERYDELAQAVQERFSRQPDPSIPWARQPFAQVDQVRALWMRALDAVPGRRVRLVAPPFPVRRDGATVRTGTLDAVRFANGDCLVRVDGFDSVFGYAFGELELLEETRCPQCDRTCDAGCGATVALRVGGS